MIIWHEVVVNVSKVASSYGALRLHVFVTESNIAYGGDVYNFVNRLMVPNQNGTALDFSSQSSHQVTLPFNLSGSWVYSNCEVVAYLQNNSTKEIYQAVKLSMNDFNQGIMANFTANTTEVITGQSATFTDLSTGDPTSWNWTFEGGSPSTYTGQTPPAVYYNTPGYYDVTLTVSDGVDSDTEVKTDYIFVADHCEASGGGYYLYISNVLMGDINNSSGQTEYADYSYLITDLAQGQSGVELTITNGDPYNQDDIGVWIDWNQDGDFIDAGELVICEPELGWATTGFQTFYFDVPPDAPLGTTTARIRLKYVGADCGSSCGSTSYGEVEDYSVNIVPDVDPPIADFIADFTMPVVGETVSLYDMSQNNPTAWEWSFDPTTVTFTGGTDNQSQNPLVQFGSGGFYTVTLIATNAGGSDTETKYDYIFASNPILSLDITVFCEGPFDNGGMQTLLNGNVPLSQPYNEAPWNYNGNEYVAGMPANIVDWVILELRDASAPELATPEKVIGKKAVLLRDDGKLVALDGLSMVEFETSFSDGLYAVVHHRNHLSIISSSGLTNNSGIFSWNFTNSEAMAYGGANAQNELDPGIWGMIGGDSNADGTIDAMDIDLKWMELAGMNGYQSSDYNFDAEVNNIDKNDFSILNYLKSTMVP
ncbi:MAG: PKD domain-containing protein [Bacteroidales bacterium]